MAEWPPRHKGAFFKVKAHKERRSGKGVTAKLRAAKARKRKAAENSEMAKARERDQYCRFILCPCRMHGSVPQISHVRHRGMGGNPALDRTTAETLLALCEWRHKGSRFSMDRGTIKWVPVSPEKGADGPILWLVNASAFPNDEGHFWLQTQSREDGWIPIAAEIAPHRYYPLNAFPATQRLVDYLTVEWGKGNA